MKSALLTYIGLLEVDKAAFPSLVDVLRENRYNKFSFRQISLFSVHKTCNQDKPAVLRKLKVLSKNRFAKFFSRNKLFQGTFLDVDKAAFPSLVDVLGENR